MSCFQQFTLPRRAVLAGALGVVGAAGSTAVGKDSASALAAVRGPAAITIGAHTEGMDAQPKLLDAVAASVGVPMGIASVFRGQGDLWPGPLEQALAGSRTLLVSWHLDWQPYSYWVTPDARAYLVAAARRVKAYGRPVAIRPWAEMNGDWQPFQPTAQAVAGFATGYDAFKAAWRAVVSVFRAEKVANVRWVFNPTTDTYAETTDVGLIWPGASYVDVLGLDGYNWGTGGIHTWSSFADIYREQYGRLTGLSATLPVWVCEVGSADPLSSRNSVRAPAGASKDLWWRDMAAAVRSMPSVQALVLFDVCKERDWRVASSTSSLAGARSAMAALHPTNGSRALRTVRRSGQGS